MATRQVSSISTDILDVLPCNLLVLGCPLRANELRLSVRRLALATMGELTSEQGVSGATERLRPSSQAVVSPTAILVRVLAPLLTTSVGVFRLLVVPVCHSGITRVVTLRTSRKLLLRISKNIYSSSQSGNR